MSYPYAPLVYGPFGAVCGVICRVVCLRAVAVTQTSENRGAPGVSEILAYKGFFETTVKVSLLQLRLVSVIFALSSELSAEFLCRSGVSKDTDFSDALRVLSAALLLAISCSKSIESVVTAVRGRREWALSFSSKDTPGVEGQEEIGEREGW
jgi:hypothetical protein